MKKFYWGVMDGTRAQFPHSFHGTYNDAKKWCRHLNEVRKDFWVKRFEVNLKGRAVDIYTHEYRRK